MIVVLPMAGRGSRFSGNGYTIPKPYISVGGHPIFAWALASLSGMDISKIIVIALSEHYGQVDLDKLLERYVGDSYELILLDDVTEGQLCTVLAARSFLDTEEDLLVMCADTLMVSHLGEDIARRRSTCQGLISVFSAPGDRWSFAETDETGRVVRVAEKVRISDHASTGYYYFNNARQFLEIAKSFVDNKEKIRGEYFVMPVYQKYIECGYRVEISEAMEVWDLGTPDALRIFESNGLARISLTHLGVRNG